MPPFWRSRCVQPRTRRVAMCLQLRELDLQLAFEAARALREDVEDQPGAIEHAALRALLEVALLARRQRVIEQHHVGAMLERAAARISSALPLPTDRRGSGAGACRR